MIFVCSKHTKRKPDAQDAPTDDTQGMMETTIQLKLSRSMEGREGGSRSPQPVTKFRLHPPPLGPLGPMMYPPTGWGPHAGRYMFSRHHTNLCECHHTRGEIPGKLLVTDCRSLPPPPPHIPPGTGGERELMYPGRPMPS